MLNYGCHTAEWSAVQNADDCAGTGADCGELIKMARIYGVFPLVEHRVASLRKVCVFLDSQEKHKQHEERGRP